MLVFKFPFGPLQTNAILIGCPKTNKGAVVDPSAGSAGPILQKSEEHHLKIEKILLTHSHWDHFADAAQIQKATLAPLYVHPLDAENVKKPGSDGIPLFYPVPPIQPDHLFKEDEKLEVGTVKVEVIHTPGHSPGSVCFYFSEERLLLSGDTLFQGSYGNLALPTGNPPQMWNSLKKLATLPPDTRVIPGHGRETSIGQENWLSRAEEIFSE